MFTQEVFIKDYKNPSIYLPCGTQPSAIHPPNGKCAYIWCFVGVNLVPWMNACPLRAPKNNTLFQAHICNGLKRVQQTHLWFLMHRLGTTGLDCRWTLAIACLILRCKTMCFRAIKSELSIKVLKSTKITLNFVQTLGEHCLNCTDILATLKVGGNSEEQLYPRQVLLLWHHKPVSFTSAAKDLVELTRSVGICLQCMIFKMFDT